MISDSELIQEELARAESQLRSLCGQSIEAVTINSHDADEAPLLALIVSKLSPILGNLLERRITDLLDGETVHGFRWIRQDPDFPDALLINKDGSSTDAGYEVKAWYIFATEITGRFRESVNLLANRNIHLVLAAWSMSHLIYGTPQVLDVAVFDAMSIAKKRDEHYNSPPEYITIEPEDTTDRTSNLQQTNVNGYRLQESDPQRIEEARRLVRNHPGRNAPPHSPESQELNKALMNQFSYRLDTNFAKLDRIDHPEVERFKASIMKRTLRDRQVSEWFKILRDLVRNAQLDIIREVYKE